MSGTGRQVDFERLIAMRDGYARADDDRVAVLSIDDAIRYTEAIMTAVELDAEPWTAAMDEASAKGAGDRPAGRPVRSPRLTRFASDLSDNLRYADSFFGERLRPLCDAFLERSGETLPDEEPAQVAHGNPSVRTAWARSSPVCASQPTRTPQIA